MIDSGNSASIHLLTTIGFENADNIQMAINKETGSEVFLYRYCV